MRTFATRYGSGLLAFVLVLSALAILVRATRPKIEPRFCGDVFRLIELGMSRQEVENIFGEPEGDYNTGPFIGPSCGVGLPFKRVAEEQIVSGLIWTYDDWEFTVGLDRDRKVVYVGSVPNLYGTSRPRSFFEGLRDFVKSCF